MDKMIRAAGVDIELELEPATLISADPKRNSQTLVAGSAADLVFRLKATGEEQKVRVKKRSKDLAVNEEVLLIYAGDCIIGYADAQGREYHYLTNDFCGKLGLGISVLLVWLVAVMGAVVLFVAGFQSTMDLFIPAIIIVSIFGIQRWFLNMRIRQALDQQFAQPALAV